MNDTEFTMSLENLQGIENKMRHFEDHALIRLVAIEQTDYRSEALSIAINELRRRNLNPMTAEEYYEKFPLERILPSRFCVGCHLQTTDESPGDTSTFNFVGTRLVGLFDRCSVCGSVLQRKWYCLIVPIIPLGKYRVIYLEKNPLSSRYIGRKMRKQDDHTKGANTIKDNKK